MNYSNFSTVTFHHHHHHNHHHQSVLPEGRYTTSAGTQAAVLPKAGLPPQTQESRLQLYQALNRCGKFPLLAHLTLSLTSEQTLKYLKYSRGTSVEVRRVNVANWTLLTSPKFTTGVKYQFHWGFDQIRDPKIPITLLPLLHVDRIKELEFIFSSVKSEKLFKKAQNGHYYQRQKGSCPSRNLREVSPRPNSDSKLPLSMFIIYYK